MTDLTPDHVDALLRDPNTPGDVRSSVLAEYEVNRYLDTVEFHEDNDGLTHVRPRPADERSTSSPRGGSDSSSGGGSGSRSRSSARSRSTSGRRSASGTTGGRKGGK